MGATFPTGVGARLRLGAYQAARAFPRRHALVAARRRISCWMLVALRWRRALTGTAGAPGMLPRSAQPAGRSPWQVHLHLRVAPGSAEPRRPSPCTMLRARRPAEVHAAPAFRPTQALQQCYRSRVSARSGGTHGIETHGRDTSGGHTSGTGLPAALRSRLRGGETAAPSALSTTPKLAIAAMYPGARAAGLTVTRLSVQRAPATGAAQAQPVAPRRRCAQASTPQALQFLVPRAAAVIDAFFSASPELAWRTRAASPSASAASQQERSQQTTGTRSATSMQELPAEFAAAPAAIATLRAYTLDPVFADRLAEDVIRRIDRRLRIERERRGL